MEIKHDPLCKVNISCAVYHQDGVCPDANVCTCSSPEKEQTVVTGVAGTLVHSCGDEDRKLGKCLKCFKSFSPESVGWESWEDRFWEKFGDKGDERFGLAKHNNTIIQRQIDFLHDEFHKAFEAGRKEGAIEAYDDGYAVGYEAGRKAGIGEIAKLPRVDVYDGGEAENDDGDYVRYSAISTLLK